MKKLIIITICLISLVIQGFSQATIAEARAMGVGATVTVRGIVTNGSELGTAIRYIQDATAGIAGYKGGQLGGVLRGDSVTFTGTLKNYNQLLEIDPLTSFTVLANGKPVPEPQVITPGQLSEPYESELVKMLNVTFANGGGVFAGNTNYNVSANGQTCQVRVNNASNLVGQIIPADEVTIIGICSQFHYSDPNAGYQLLLRDQDDIISASAIAFTTPLAISNIATTSFSLDWKTNISGTTELYYGLTPQLELGHQSVAGTDTIHNINLSGLNPSDLIYVQAFSVASQDTAWSGLKPFITQSVSSGTIKTYFTRSVDTTVSTGTNAIQIYRAVDDTCIAYITRAKYSIDVAIYNFNVEGLSSIAGALNAAYNRGCVVRLVTDGGTNNSAIPDLVAGIGKIGRPVTVGIMHNKFMVIDGNSTNPNDPIVWTGSCNWTDQNVNTDANNVLFIQDASLAKVYTLEFNEMFGSTTAIPDPANAKFGSAKSDNTPHELIIGGNRVEVFFSPSDGVNQQIVNHVNTANSDIKVGTMLITRTVISNAIIARKNAGVDAKVVISNRATSDAVVVADLSAALGNNFKEYHEQGLLHSKAMIIDQANSASDPFVWTGSHNWSDAANVNNDENSIVIHDPVISNVFYQEYKKRFDLAIPISEHPVLDLGPDQTVAAGDIVTLDAGQFLTYVWSTGDLTQIVQIDSSGTGFGVKKVYCRVTNEYGTQSDTVMITFVSHSILDLGPDQTVFAGQTVTLDAGLFNTYLWSNGATTRSIVVDSTGVGNGTKKVYCSVTDYFGNQSDTVRITFEPKAVLDLGPDQTVFVGETVTFDAGLFDTYLWSTGATTRIITVDSAGVGYGTKKVYCSATDQFGIQSDTVRITFKPNTGIDDQNALISQLSVYPNPATGEFTVGFNAKRSEVINLELVSFDGRVVWQSRANAFTGSNAIRVPDVKCPSGIYLVRIKTAEGDVGRKIVVK